MSAQESSQPRGPYLLSMPCAPAISDLPGDEINFWCVGTHWPFAPLSGWETVNDYFHGFGLCPTRKKCFNRHVFFHPRPNEQEMHLINPCTCSLDPMKVCGLHLCQCNKCKSGDPLACKWRAAHLDYLAKKGVNLKLEAGTLQYMNLIESQSWFRIRPEANHFWMDKDSKSDCLKYL